MQYKNYLNVGCGGTFYKSWTNIDVNVSSPFVISHNLLKGLPFEDNKFDVVYHSQVLEHFSKLDAPKFISECYRVLKVGGVLRVVVPCLENICNEYSRLLNENLTTPSDESSAHYDWILLEMFDQMVRNKPGGMMVNYLQNLNASNRQYVLDRLGYFDIKPLSAKSKVNLFDRVKDFSLIKAYRFALRKLNGLHLTNSQKIGMFRLGGEIHQWMYDRFSLSRLLSENGFNEICVVSPLKSSILNWELFELDVKNGVPRNPTSLYMEAKKLL